MTANYLAVDYGSKEDYLTSSPGLPLDPLPNNKLFWGHREEGLGTTLVIVNVLV